MNYYFTKSELKMNNETEQIFLINTSENQPSSSQKINEVEIPVTATVNLENVEDFTNVCRTCATVTEFLIPIFDGEGAQNNLADKIHKYLPIQVSAQDALPRALCYACAHTLLASHALAAAAARTDRALRARLRAPAQEQNPIGNEENLNLEKEQNESKTTLETVVRTILNNFLRTLNMTEDLDVEFVCIKCADNGIFTSIGDLLEHIKSVHRSEVEKDTAEEFIKENITFQETLTLTSDREEESSVEVNRVILPSFHCPFCKCVFSCTTRLVCHLSQHVELSAARGVLCCDKQYNDHKLFVAHLQKWHVSPDAAGAAHACKSCGFPAASAEHLQSHISTNHKDVTLNKTPGPHGSKRRKYIRVPCPECHKVFSNKYHMLFHLRSHTERTRHHCDKCDKSFSYRNNLRAHQKLVHEGVFNYPCKFCGERFPRRGARDTHERLHSGEAPYACRRCPKAFRSRLSLARHADSHLDERNYGCHLCAKSFKRSGHLKNHLRTHDKQ